MIVVYVPVNCIYAEMNASSVVKERVSAMARAAPDPVYSCFRFFPYIYFSLSLTLFYAEMNGSSMVKERVSDMARAAPDTVSKEALQVLTGPADSSGKKQLQQYYPSPCSQGYRKGFHFTLGPLGVGDSGAVQLYCSSVMLLDVPCITRDVYQLTGSS
jgi:hypothetical protein